MPRFDWALNTERTCLSERQVFTERKEIFNSNTARLQNVNKNEAGEIVDRIKASDVDGRR